MLLSVVMLLCAVGAFFAALYKMRTALPTRLGTTNALTTWSQRFNRLANALPFVSTYLRVYVIGVTDTISTLFWRRGLSGQVLYDRAIERLIQSYAQSGQTALVTGGDSGIGFEITRGLLQAGFTVIIASRTPELAERAKEKLGKDSDRLKYMTVDLASFKSVQGFVAQVKKALPKGGIDVLINNAGVMNVPYRKTEDGLESQFQINCISPLFLTLMLLPWINNKRGRILFASSSTLFATSTVDLSMARTTYRLDGLTHYAHSKRCIALLTRCLQSQLDTYHINVKAFCYHPGAVRTNLFAHTTLFTLPLLGPLFDFIMLTPKEGSLTPLYLALGPAKDLVKYAGQYWSDTVPVPIPHTTPCLAPDDTHRMLWTCALQLCDLTETDATTIISTCDE
ncbi:hypothetical protein BX666DRAFT_1606047 [Dichotomocladium elegans]|nr:hypothetical protein BX666DRAFT_1606047 [Dichotomocladium elegans]